ncbi:hypothetical protein CHISP_3030 [Chitinispirillum alkaliphilum]|nr:hypothetical protein CHISP_3030 [Chitinispirillum alkaliphilum]
MTLSTCAGDKTCFPSGNYSLIASIVFKGEKNFENESNTFVLTGILRAVCRKKQSGKNVFLQKSRFHIGKNLSPAPARDSKPLVVRKTVFRFFDNKIISGPI